MTEAKKSVYMTLSSVNCNEHTEKKNGLTYLSWAWAWAEVKKRYPTANYTIYETPEGRPYWDDGRTCWVKTGVTIEGLEHIEYLPVMDNRNNSIPVERVTSFDVNKSIQRSLTKAAARHGLGLYIYAGEDLPEDAEKDTAPAPAPKQKKETQKKADTDIYEPLPAPQYWSIVKAYAEGRKTKTGGDYRTTWAEATHAREEDILKFDRDVDNYRAGNVNN